MIQTLCLRGEQSPDRDATGENVPYAGEDYDEEQPETLTERATRITNKWLPIKLDVPRSFLGTFFYIIATRITSGGHSLQTKMMEHVWLYHAQLMPYVMRVLWVRIMWG